MSKIKSGDEIIIRGIITPCEWNDNESVKSISISSEDEQEYLVEDSVKGRELLRNLRKMICASGTCREDEDGRKYFKVKKYWRITSSSMI